MTTSRAAHAAQATRATRECAEHYALTLAETARKMGHLNRDLVQLQHAVKFSPEVMSLLAILHDHGKADLLPEIVDAYKEIVNNNDTTAYVVVTTAVEMDDELRERVRAHIEKKFAKRAYLVERVDPAIVGGIIIETQGERYDASVATQLVHMHKQLASVYLGSDDE